jgi:hypothetical protein
MMSHTSMKINFILCIIISIFSNKCDHGLAPPEPERKITGIRGTIYYQNWPPAISIYDLRLVIFKHFPPDDIRSEVISGEAVVYPAIGDDPLPYPTDSTSYLMELDPGRYEYLVVAQQYRPDPEHLYLKEFWRVVGQYDTTLSDTLPSAVTVIKDSVLQSINIHVDFGNLPIQPF